MDSSRLYLAVSAPRPAGLTTTAAEFRRFRLGLPSATAVEREGSRILLPVDALQRREPRGLLGMTAEEDAAVSESRRESLLDELTFNIVQRVSHILTDLGYFNLGCSYTGMSAHGTHQI